MQREKTEGIPRPARRESAALNRELRKKGIIGRDTYVSLGTAISDKRTRIGKFCSIARNVMIGTTSHPTGFLTTSPIPYRNMHNLTEGLVFPDDKLVKYTYSRPITIGNDVWIGMNAVIMDGITIGDGTVIGAGSIVTHDVLPYAVAGGSRPRGAIPFRRGNDPASAQSPLVGPAGRGDPVAEDGRRRKLSATTGKSAFDLNAQVPAPVQ